VYQQDVPSKIRTATKVWDLLKNVKKDKDTNQEVSKVYSEPLMLDLRFKSMK
jgi:hypothetical protein